MHLIGATLVTMEYVAIFGAAGAIGKAVGAELERRGVRFRVVGRSRQKLEQAFAKMTHAEIFPADLSEARSSGAAARGVDTIFYCVGLPYPSHHLHPLLMRTTVEAAKLVRVERLVLPSSVYSYGVPRASSVAETHPREPHTRKGKYRKEQEDLVMEAHAAGALQGMTVRLPDFYGPHADIGLANPMFRAALAGKTANWVGPVNPPHEFVYVPDTGPVIVDLASRAQCYGEAWNFAGAATINTMDFITRIYRAVGRAPRYRTVGAGMLKFLGWFNPAMREVVEMLYLQETPVILDDRKLMALLPVHKTPYDDGIRQTLEWMRTG
ncbi:MAG: NAD-dependent epimerase/dehydratase family protein [Candidatus Solibacter sp.]|nr:NAD-dependent epimerase/dehydratase family protein [Candidatus Solibacter sp.]